jgi:membrane associated rhomboid family serine protease
MADEPGDVCDHCDESLRPNLRNSRGFSLGYAPVTWALITLNFVISFVGSTLAVEGIPFGAMSGPAVLNGAWWQLISAQFVHLSIGHLLGNVFFLWFLGKRLERIFGSWTFLFLYFVCGLSCGVLSLALSPELYHAGASGAVFGVAGSLISNFSLNFKKLSRRQRFKLALLVLWIGLNLYDGFPDPTIGNDGHIGGLCMGLILGAILSVQLASSAWVRCWVFSGSALVLLVAAFLIRGHNLYLVHLDRADRAMRDGRTDIASTEIHVARSMKPDSSLVKASIMRLKQFSTTRDSCLSLPLNPSRPISLVDPCAQLKCDGLLHASNAPDGREFYYLGLINATRPFGANNGMQTSLTETLTMQAIDEFGEIACTTSWERLRTQAVDQRGRPVGRPIQVSESVGTKSEFDPVAQSMRDQIEKSSGHP